jgi:Flp pilus assembly protein TadB
VTKRDPAGPRSTWLRVRAQRRSLSQMNGEETPMPESGRAKRSSSVFLPLGIVFLAVATTMVFLGTTAWIAFFTMAITFLILALQNRTGKGKRLPSGNSQA